MLPIANATAAQPQAIVAAAASAGDDVSGDWDIDLDPDLNTGVGAIAPAQTLALRTLVENRLLPHQQPALAISQTTQGRHNYDPVAALANYASRAS